MNTPNSKTLSSMSIFTIEKKEDTPEVLVDFENGTIKFTGKLLPEDSIAFFAPIDEQIKKYTESAKQNTTVDLKLEYMNSSSQKRMIDLLSLLQSLTQNGIKVNINWHYPEDDDDLLDEGKDLMRMLDKPINIIPY